MTPRPVQHTPGVSGGGLHRRLCLHHLPDEDFVYPGTCGVTNRRGIKLCHQILTSN
jgi:hypothetical protein